MSSAESLMILFRHHGTSTRQSVYGLRKELEPISAYSIPATPDTIGAAADVPEKNVRPRLRPIARTTPGAATSIEPKPVVFRVPKLDLSVLSRNCARASKDF